MNSSNINNIYERASQRIKLFRKYKGLTQAKLSENTNFSRGYIGNIESVKTEQTFSLGLLYCLSEKMDIPIELFVKEDISKELQEMGIKE